MLNLGLLLDFDGRKAEAKSKRARRRAFYPVILSKKDFGFCLKNDGGGQTEDEEVANRVRYRLFFFDWMDDL